MWSCTRYGLGLAAMFLMLMVSSSRAQEGAKQISEEEIKVHLGDSDDCEVYVNSLDYFDFTGDGADEAVVVASTCATGTAGPDVHAVLTRLPDGSLSELKIQPTSEDIGVLLGRVFYDLEVDEGLLVETYHDTSGRPDPPLLIKYRWDGKAKQFESVSVKAAKAYRTSFDCAKAKSEIEKAICYLPNVANLDVKVSEMYKALLDQLNAADSEALLQEQKAWLHRRDVICGGDYEIGDCLETLYRARFLELGAFKSLHP